MKVLLPVALAVLTVGQASAQTRYKLNLLDLVPGATEGDNSFINNQGTIARDIVEADGTNQVSLRTGSGLSTVIRASLGPSYVTALGQNDNVGVLRYGRVAALWSPYGGPIDYAPTNATFSAIFGLSNSGRIVGNAAFGDGGHAWNFVSGSGNRLFTDGTDVSTASAMNGAGQIVGWKAVPNTSFSRAFLQRDGVTTDLGTLPGSDSSSASAISESGLIAGTSSSSGATPTNQAFLWSATGGLLPLANLVGAAEASVRSVNGSGVVLGTSRFGALPNATYVSTLWQDGSSYRFDALVDDLSGWSNVKANGINDSGLIVGSGVYNGVRRSFVANPVPEPSALLAMPLGLVLLARSRRRKA